MNLSQVINQLKELQGLERHVDSSNSFLMTSSKMLKPTVANYSMPLEIEATYSQRQLLMSFRSWRFYFIFLSV